MFMSVRQAILLAALLMVAVVLSAAFSKSAEAVEADEVWATAFEESPDNSDAISAGAAKVRASRSNVRARLEVEHFFGGTAASEDDDNGLHRLGSGRCYMTEVAPTGLFDSHSGIGLITDLEDLNVSTPSSNDGTLANISSGAAGAAVEDDIGHGRCWIDTDGADGNTNDECTGFQTSAGTGSPVDATPNCCTATDTGTCDLDDNKMYTYLGVAGDAGSPPTGLVAGWQEVLGGPDPNQTVASQLHLTPSYLTNGDFEWNATDAGTACDSTTRPSEWTDLQGTPPTYTYATIATEGIGCAVTVVGVAANDGISQILNNLQVASTYRVTARVDAAVSNDICVIQIDGALTEVEGSHTGTDIETISSTFTTHATVVDDVTISLRGTDASDDCTWDHVSVRRETRTPVTDVGVIAVYDTYTTSPGADVEEAATGYADVPELTISFTPPTPGWVAQIGATVSLGCTDDCAVDADAGFSCQLEKDGTLIAGTQMHQVGFNQASDSSNVSYTANLTAMEINPVPGTDIVYTVACREEGVNGMVFNYQSPTNTTDSQSNLWMMAYPPH